MERSPQAKSPDDVLQALPQEEEVQDEASVEDAVAAFKALSTDPLLHRGGMDLET